ncbi:MAG TPA: plastocyanin/azurin family copper-binding protein, partial [Candidatus Gracilibacteria bacterium]|nr:plastocyanin/azurin family copper-binding protein [Candidatus Gracilibacteria bacterium]
LEAANADHEPATLTFNVDGGNFYFTPNEIRVKKGDTVKIVFNNTGGMHNFVLDEFNVTMDPIKESGSQTVEFVADKVGSFEYYCSVGSHRQMGMKGTVIVEE